MRMYWKVWDLSMTKVTQSKGWILSWFWLEELLFSIEAHTTLYFGFVIKIMLVTHQCFSFCRAVLIQS